jgi:hypothetical protein
MTRENKVTLRMYKYARQRGAPFTEAGTANHERMLSLERAGLAVQGYFNPSTSHIFWSLTNAGEAALKSLSRRGKLDERQRTKSSSEAC